MTETTTADGGPALEDQPALQYPWYIRWYNQRHNRRVFRQNNVEYQTFPTIFGRLRIAKFTTGGTIRIGRDVVINSTFSANPVGGVETVLLIKGPEALIEIGDEVGISNAIIAARRHIRIGNNVNIGAGVKIFDNDFHSADFAERAADINIPTAPVSIGDRAWIGGDATVLKGVTIGEESVIGLGSIVTRDVPPGEIWAGIPAKFIRKIHG
jgi:acetyltransferase-like isoleucine patch superfamily enzyme